MFHCLDHQINALEDTKAELDRLYKLNDDNDKQIARLKHENEFYIELNASKKDHAYFQRLLDRQKKHTRRYIDLISHKVQEDLLHEGR